MQALDVEETSAGHLQFAPRREGVEVVRGDADKSVPAPVSARPLFALTTPGWLRVAIVTITIAAVLLGAVGVRAALERRDTADTVALEATPLLVDAQDLYVALADADAAASTAFLRAGSEPPDLRRRFLDDVERAGVLQTDIGANDAATPDVHGALAVIASELPRYAGLVDTARSNGLQNNAVGAAYLRRASDLMRTTILPAASTIYREAALELDARQRSGISPSARAAVTTASAVLLLVLVATQVYVSSRTRRIVNVGLAMATLVVVGTAVLAHTALTDQEDALTRAREEGSDQLVTFSTARILALRSLSDENLDLIERGTVDEHMVDFANATADIGSTSDRTGLLGTAVELADDDDEELRIRVIGSMMDDYVATHEAVRDSVAERDFDDAVDIVATDQAGAIEALDAALDGETDEASADLARFAGDARDALRWLAPALAFLTLLAWALAAVGIEIRLKEYR